MSGKHSIPLSSSSSSSCHLTVTHSCMKLSLCDGELLNTLCSQITTMEPESGNRLLNVLWFALLPTGEENK